MSNQMTSQQREKALSTFQNSSKAIKSILKQFQYDSSISHADNITKLGACLQSVMQGEYMDDFIHYISDLDALPIQINLQSLRYDNLAQLFQDWIHTQQQHSSLHLQHAITVRFRNILFKQILLQEKQTIDDYFETLSQKKRLKGFDLYQLLQTLMSSYFLYQFHSDSVNFFEKINSFENFMSIVDQFIVNERRIITKDKQNPDDYKYIRRFQFDQLLEFWENINQQLTLLHENRKNHISTGVQTIIVNSVDSQTQISKIRESDNYLGFVNYAIHEVNRLIETENTPQVLVSLNKVFDVLRKQKIVALNSYTNHDKNISEDPNRTFSYISTHIHHKINKSPFKTTSHNRSPAPVPYIQNKNEEKIKKIFKFLLQQTEKKRLSVSQLQIFFYQIRLVKAHQNYLIRNLLDNHLIEDPDDITFEEFKNVIDQLIKESDKLTPQILKQYIENFVVTEEKKYYERQKKERKRTPLTERPHYYGLLEKKSTPILSRSTFQLDSQES